MSKNDDSEAFHRGVESEASKLNTLYARTGAAIMTAPQLTLRDVLDEVAQSASHIEFTPEELERIRVGFGLPPSNPPRRDNVVRLRPRNRTNPNGGEAA